MPRPIVAILKSLRAAMWRHGLYPESLRVEREDGRVRLVLDLGPDEIVDDEPRKDASMSLGARTR